MRKQESCLEKEMIQITMPGARRRGRPRTVWMDNINTWTGLLVEESIRMTEDRDKWRKYVHGVACGQPLDRGRLKRREHNLYGTFCGHFRHLYWLYGCMSSSAFILLSVCLSISLPMFLCMSVRVWYDVWLWRWRRADRCLVDVITWHDDLTSPCHLGLY